MQTLLQALVAGALVGGLYGLVSIGLSLIFGVMRIVNFAHGEFVMLGMYATYALWALLRIDPLLSLLIVLPAFFVFGAAIERFLVRRVVHAPDLAQIFLTVGLSIVLVNGALLAFTPDVRTVSAAYSNSYWDLAGVVVPIARLIAFGGAVVLSAVLAVFLLRTNLGRAMRAAAQDREVAMLMGIDPDRVFLTAFGIGTALAAAAGVFLASFFPIMPTVGTQLIVIAFVVVILGGLGNLVGAMLGGLLVGIVESLGKVYLQADWGLVLVFGIMLLVLNLRPSGLLAGTRLG
jgi:branched-chain amino acid transport system permease protein